MTKKILLKKSIGIILSFCIMIMLMPDFTINVNAVDNTAPTISSATLSADNSYIDIIFNEGTYGADDGATALTADKLALTFNQNTGNATNVSISSIKKDDNYIEGDASALTGGETTVRVFFSITGVPNGAETIEIKPANSTSIYDQAGNAMLATQTTGVKTLYDGIKPTINSLNPADNAIYFDRNNNLVITFSENVVVGTGDIEIHMTSDDSVVETIPVTSDKVTGSGTNTITINPSLTLMAGTEYYALIDSTAFQDTSGNSFSGITANDTWNFTTAPISNYAALSRLELLPGNLYPSFNPNCICYSANVTYWDVYTQVIATASNSNASIKVNNVAVASGNVSDTINLNVGSNTITVEVTAEDGVTTKTYTITVTRSSRYSTNADIDGSGSGSGPDSAGDGVIIQPTETAGGEETLIPTLQDEAENIKDAVLTAEDIEKLENGSDISIKLKVAKIEAPQADKDAINSVLDEESNIQLGQCVDLSLFKSIDGEEEKVTQTNSPIKITMDIPENLRNSGRTFSIIRVHDGVATILKDLDGNPITITVETDQFSTYAIAYEDIITGENPKTGDNSTLPIALVAILSAITFVISRKKIKAK